MLVEVRSCTQIFVRYTYLPSKPTFVFEVVSNGDSKIGLEVGESFSFPLSAAAGLWARKQKESGRRWESSGQTALISKVGAAVCIGKSQPCQADDSLQTQKQVYAKALYGTEDSRCVSQPAVRYTNLKFLSHK